MSQKFKRGDLVRLKSGGPAMTVVEYGHWSGETEEQVNCRWFVDMKSLPLEQVFFEEELEAAPTAGDGGHRSSPFPKGGF